MNLLFESKYQKIIYHEDVNAIEQRFNELSNEIFGDEYIKEIESYGKIIQEFNQENKTCHKLIINILDGGPAMSPKIQEFMHNDFYPRIVKAGITTKAYCFGEEIIANLSVEMTAEENPKSQFVFEYFSDLEVAKAWLKGK